MKQRHEDSVFASKRLAEVSKGIHKEQLHKDASALFSSSFEKDGHGEVSCSFANNRYKENGNYLLMVWCYTWGSGQ